jgi:hypothetical protein
MLEVEMHSGGDSKLFSHSSATTPPTLALVPSSVELLEDPKDCRWTYYQDHATYPLWGDCCQRRLILTVPGLTQSRQPFRCEGKVNCPYCGFAYHLLIKSVHGPLGGHTVKKLDMERAWREWLEKRDAKPTPLKVVGLASLAQKRRKVLKPMLASSTFKRRLCKKRGKKTARHTAGLIVTES